MPSAEIHRRNLLAILQAALARVNGRGCVQRYLQAHSQTTPIYLIAIGKAAVAMSRGAIDVLEDGIHDGLVITKHGHEEVLPWPCLTAGHPLPDAASLSAGDELLRFISCIPVDGRVLVLLSGGASALVERLPDGVVLEQLQALNHWLLGAGLDIHACNDVRKRVSLIKGGRLASLLSPRSVLCLTISDAPDNDPRVIGSGPLVADSRLSTPSEFVANAPDFVRELIDKAPPAPGVNDPVFKAIETVIVATLDDAKHAAAEAATSYGYRTTVEPEFVSGDACAAGTQLARTLCNGESGVVHVWGGETQVVLPPDPGRGGRNQSLALAAAIELAGHGDVFFLAAGTDGTDGPGDDAGALVDGATVVRGKSNTLDAVTALQRADAGSFLQASGDLLRTGPTGTNVMDIMMGLKV